MIDPEFWRGRRVFITGHTGFKGSWLTLWLNSLGADVTGYALPPPTVPSLFEAANVSQGMHSIIGDVRDAVKLHDALKVARPEIVFHLAAQPLVRRSYVDPVETYSTNVMGLVHLFEGIRAVDSVKACVNVTSDKCYENREWVYGYREIDSMGGYDPYSSSKGCAELVTAAYRRSFFSQGSDCIVLASARAGNVIGGGDWAEDRLIPDIFRAVEAREAVRIRNPSAIRPWQHVLEPLSGYLTLAQKLVDSDGEKFAQAWNFGPSAEDTRPVEWIVTKIVNLWGQGASWKKDTREGPYGAHFLSLDCLKAHRELSWRPVWSLSETIEKIVAWRHAYLAESNMRDETLDQISAYCKDMTGGSL